MLLAIDFWVMYAHILMEPLDKMFIQPNLAYVSLEVNIQERRTVINMQARPQEYQPQAGWLGAVAVDWLEARNMHHSTSESAIMQ